MRLKEPSVFIMENRQENENEREFFIAGDALSQKKQKNKYIFPYFAIIFSIYT